MNIYIVLGLIIPKPSVVPTSFIKDSIVRVIWDAKNIFLLLDNIDIINRYIIEIMTVKYILLKMDTDSIKTIYYNNTHCIAKYH